MNNSTEKRHLGYDEIILDLITKEPGLTFNQIRFRLEEEKYIPEKKIFKKDKKESTINNNLKKLLKRKIIIKKDNIYFRK